MTDEKNRNEETGESRQRWIKDVQDALGRTGDAVRTAWEATRDSRMGALESAKQAAKELGEVLEKGAEAAKERWEAEAAAEKKETDTAPPPETPPATQTPPASAEPIPPAEPPAQTPPGDIPPLDEPDRP